MKSTMDLIVLLLMIMPDIYAFGYGPSNKAVLLGSDVVMNCGSNESISRQWKLRNVNYGEVTLSDELNIFWNSIELNTNSSEQYDLHISPVHEPKVGTYSCILHNPPSDKGLQMERYEAYLAVLSSEPECSTNISGPSYTVTENDVIEAQCNVTYYSVRNNLRMKWMLEDLNIINSTTVSSNIETGYYRVTSSITFKVAAQNNTWVLSCFTYFTEINESISSDPTLVKATNAPDYNHTCIIPSLNVQSNRCDTETGSSNHHVHLIAGLASVVAAHVINYHNGNVLLSENAIQPMKNIDGCES